MVLKSDFEKDNLYLITVSRPHINWNGRHKPSTMIYTMNNFIIKFDHYIWESKISDHVIHYLILATDKDVVFPYGTSGLKEITESRPLEVKDLLLYINWYKTVYFNKALKEMGE